MRHCVDVERCLISRGQFELAGTQFSKRDKAREAKRKQQGLFEENPPGVDPLWHFFALFRLLQLSQSYWLAHQDRFGANPENERPHEYAKVLNTYDLFGPVWEIPFWEWWRDRARMHFGSDEVVRVVGQKQTTEPRDTPTNVVRLTLSVPLIGTQSGIIRQVEDVLRQHRDSWSPSPPPAAYKVIKDRTRKDTMNAAIRAAQARAHFVVPLHVIGKRSKLAPSKWDEIDPIALTELTSRHIRRAHIWAENAARGRFPSQDPPPKDGFWPKFDFEGGLRDRLAAYARISEEAIAAIPEEKRTSEHRYAGRNRTIAW
jgi:hypothetical protein